MLSFSSQRDSSKIDRLGHSLGAEMLNRSTFVRIGAVALIAAAAWAGSERASSDPIVVVNGTRTAMITLQLKPSDARAWQPDLLARGPLGVQKETTFQRPGHVCIYDLKAMFEDGHRVVKQRVNLCKTERYVVSDF